MKKVLFIFHDTNITGASMSLLWIIQNLINTHKYDIHILLASRNGAINDILAKYNVKIYAYDKINNKNLFTKLWSRIVYFPQYILLLLRVRPTIAYSNTIMNLGEVIIARIMNVYTLVHAHEGKNFMQKHETLIKIADYFTSEYITVSQYALNSLLKFTHKKTQKNIVYNGIKIAKKRSLLFSRESIINLSVIATIDRNKSQLTAIQALEYLAHSTSYKLHLNFFGNITDICYYKELLDYISSKNLTSKVSFHGQIVDQSLMYEQTDILLITSKDETFSLTALEAFNNSIPVIASNVGGLPEVVENNTSGLLFQVDNHLDLAQQIIRFISNDILRQQIVNRAFDKASQKFNIDLTVKKVCTILDGVFNDTCR